jgi:hypothetical protein
MDYRIGGSVSRPGEFELSSDHFVNPMRTAGYERGSGIESDHAVIDAPYPFIP